MADQGRSKVMFLNVCFVPPHRQIFLSSLLNKFRSSILWIPQMYLTGLTFCRIICYIIKNENKTPNQIKAVFQFVGKRSRTWYLLCLTIRLSGFLLLPLPPRHTCRQHLAWSSFSEKEINLCWPKIPEQCLKRPQECRCNGKASWPLVSRIFRGQWGKLSP